MAPRAQSAQSSSDASAEQHGLQVEDTVAFELQETRTTRDWSKEPGKEKKCKLLAAFARNATGLPELNESETIWQINWVDVSKPLQGQKI